MSITGSEMAETGSAGTADWIEASRGITIAAYVPGDEETSQPTQARTIPGAAHDKGVGAAAEATAP